MSSNPLYGLRKVGLGLSGVQSKSAGLQPCLDVDETRSETSDDSFNVTESNDLG